MNKHELLRAIDSGITNFDGIDLSGENLDGIEINGGNLMMRGANFNGASLKGAKLSLLQLTDSDFQKANLEGATLLNCIMVRTDLFKANCQNTKFIGGFLDLSCLISTNLKNSVFHGTDWSEVLLGDTNLEGAMLGDIVNLDESEIQSIPKNMQEKTKLTHLPIHIDMATIEKTAEFQRILVKKGVTLNSTYEVFSSFFKRAGVSSILIYAYEALKNKIDENLQSVFISYSSEDQAFADKLYDELRSHEVKTWYAPKNMKGGEQIHKQIHSAIQSHDRVLLVLSENSMSSSWVATEIAKAYSREAKGGEHVLFPLSITQYENIQNWELFD